MAKGTKTKTFGGLLLAAGTELHLTQKALGQRIGVSQRTIARWGDGGWFPPPSQRYAIVYALRDLPRAKLEAIAASLGLDAASIPLASTAAQRAADPAAMKQALDAAMFAASAQLDVSARKVKEAIVPLLAQIAALGLDARQAHALLATK